MEGAIISKHPVVKFGVLNVIFIKKHFEDLRWIKKRKTYIRCAQCNIHSGKGCKESIIHILKVLIITILHDCALILKYAGCNLRCLGNPLFEVALWGWWSFWHGWLVQHTWHVTSSLPPWHSERVFCLLNLRMWCLRVIWNLLIEYSRYNIHQGWILRR